MTKQPWERSPLEITILEGFSAQIVGEEGESYHIEFQDHDMSTVGAMIEKKEFENFPHPVKEGTHFGIIVYYDNGEPIAKAWPVGKYWNEELRKDDE
jgi:hypothetical protein